MGHNENSDESEMHSTEGLQKEPGENINKELDNTY